MTNRLEGISVLAEAEDIDLSVDELLQLLSDRRARATIVVLYDRPDTTLDRLAAMVTASEAVETESVATTDEYRTTRLQLYHSTLPRLDDHGLIEFDPDEKTIREEEIHAAIYSFLGVNGANERLS